MPYVRGRERSREPEAVLEECKRLVDQGVQEITLLGQNVNSYRGGGSEFAELLRRVDALGVPRIRFMTSHPKDLSDELICAYGELAHLMPALHLPVQAGNDEILQAMNRRYTRAHYLELVKKLRSVKPDVGLTSDIIVGFPGETEAQFEDTLSLVREVRYDSAFTFIYSRRAGTRAAQMPDPTSAEEKTERIQRLIDLQTEITHEILTRQVGRRETVLVESVSARDPGWVGGKTPARAHGQFPGKSRPYRQICPGGNTLRRPQYAARKTDHGGMNAWDAVFQKTRELGQALIESDVYQAMKAAEEKAARNQEAAETMNRYLQLRAQIQEILSRENPDSAVLKKLSDEMDETQEKLNMIDDIIAMTQARSAFSDLINQVNQVLQFIVTGQVNEEGNCSGSCASCGGSCGAAH